MPGHLELSTDLGQNLALAEQLIALGEFSDHLFGMLIRLIGFQRGAIGLKCLDN